MRRLRTCVTDLLTCHIAMLCTTYCSTGTLFWSQTRSEAAAEDRFWFYSPHSLPLPWPAVFCLTYTLCGRDYMPASPRPMPCDHYLYCMQLYLLLVLPSSPPFLLIRHALSPARWTLHGLLLPACAPTLPYYYRCLCPTSCLLRRCLLHGTLACVLPF